MSYFNNLSLLGGVTNLGPLLYDTILLVLSSKN